MKFSQCVYNELKFVSINKSLQLKFIDISDIAVHPFVNSLTFSYIKKLNIKQLNDEITDFREGKKAMFQCPILKHMSAGKKDPSFYSYLKGPFVRQIGEYYEALKQMFNEGAVLTNIINKNVMTCRFMVNNVYYENQVNFNVLSFAAKKVNSSSKLKNIYGSANEKKQDLNGLADAAMSKIIKTAEYMFNELKLDRIVFQGLKESFGSKKQETDKEGNSSRDRLYLYILKKYFSDSLKVKKEQFGRSHIYIVEKK